METMTIRLSKVMTAGTDNVLSADIPAGTWVCDWVAAENYAISGAGDVDGMMIIRHERGGQLNMPLAYRVPTSNASPMVVVNLNLTVEGGDKITAYIAPTNANQLNLEVHLCRK